MFPDNPLLVFLVLFSAAATVSVHIRSNDSVPYYTLEEHWLSPSLAHYFADNSLNVLLGAGALNPILREVGPNRLASMDANNIRIQIVSHTPLPEAMFAANLTALANDELATAIAAAPAPHHLRGFCILPMAVPAAAAAELRRCIRKHGFVGALVDAHLSNGSFYDSPAYDPLWAEAVQLNVPIYLHPTYPDVADIVAVGKGLYAPSAKGEYDGYHAVALGMSAWAWHERAGLGFLRLYLGGVFERFPGLQVILGHMGELVPYFLSRTDQYLSVNRTLRLKDVYARNVYITTSGIFSLDPMATVLRATGHKRIMYSVDWPFSRNEDGAAFMQALRDGGMVNEEEFKDIAFRNAERLVGL
jgi:predicted TIM-barrel fold metal-dependent hydrolase